MEKAPIQILGIGDVLIDRENQRYFSTQRMCCVQRKLPLLMRNRDTANSVILVPVNSIYILIRATFQL